MSTLAEQLISEFADKEYAHGYMEEHGNAIIAAQIKALREQRGLTQTQLAELAGMKQERICALESVDYGAWTVKTLRKLAKAFDTDLRVSFAPFSEGIMEIVNLSRERLQVRPREEDLQRFAQCTLFQRDGKWTKTDGGHLAVVKTMTARAPVDPTGGAWQVLETNGKIANG
jgi:transcriptional regulator with XRE-family HTH domain